MFGSFVPIHIQYEGCCGNLTYMVPICASSEVEQYCDYIALASVTTVMARAGRTPLKIQNPHYDIYIYILQLIQSRLLQARIALQTRATLT